jgi:hypothetical protein
VVFPGILPCFSCGDLILSGIHLVEKMHNLFKIYRFISGLIIRIGKLGHNR